METHYSAQSSNSLANTLTNAHREKFIWIKHHCKWWSAIILEKKINYSEELVSVFIYGVNVTSKIRRAESVDFVDGFKSIVKEQVDEMDECWTQGVAEALREFYKNSPGCNYNLKTLVDEGLIKFSKRSYENYNALPPKKRSSSSDENDFESGSLVWAKYGEQWWSAMIIENDTHYILDKKYIIFWMADRSISEINNKKIIDFVDNFTYVIWTSSKKTSKTWEKGVVDTLHELYNYESNFENQDLKKLASQGLTNIPHRKNCVPEWVQIILKNNDINIGEIGSIDKKVNCPTFVKEMICKKLKTGESIDGVCLACYTTNGVELDHPLFKGQVCSTCLVSLLNNCRCVNHCLRLQARLKSTMIVKGDDGLHYFCAVCGVLGLIMMCDNDSCGRAYCFQCISDLTEKNTWDTLLTTEQWFCFVCVNSPIARVIYGREDFDVRIQELYTPTEVLLVNAPSKPLVAGVKLRVLSLFDGISAGFYALIKLNVPIEVYYASEIDIDALNISNLNFGDKITQIGDVTSITEKHIREMSPIHLFIGGSPCNDLSLVNPVRRGLFDCKGSGVLFFEFFRIILLLKKYNKDGFYWLYENVSSMQLSYRQTISMYLQCEPVLKDALSLSPHHRPRLFWGNLPSLYVQTPFQKTTLQDMLMPGRIALVPKLKTVTTKSNSLRQGKSALWPVLNAQNIPDTVWITELELIFGFPAHFTDAGNLSATQRQQVIGKAWSIPIIMHLFNFLRNFCSVTFVQNCKK